jgi:hypothetical protein
MWFIFCRITEFSLTKNFLLQQRKSRDFSPIFHRFLRNDEKEFSMENFLRNWMSNENSFPSSCFKIYIHLHVLLIFYAFSRIIYDQTTKISVNLWWKRLRSGNFVFINVNLQIFKAINIVIIIRAIKRR